MSLALYLVHPPLHIRMTSMPYNNFFNQPSKLNIIQAAITVCFPLVSSIIYNDLEVGCTAFEQPTMISQIMFEPIHSEKANANGGNSNTWLAIV